MTDKNLKMSCEKVVRYVLPGIRCEIARSMIMDHGFTQVKVANKLGLTEAAISQYISEKRGCIEISDEDIKEEIKRSAKRIIDGGGSTVLVEVCIICKLFRAKDLVPEVQEKNKTDEDDDCACTEC